MQPRTGHFAAGIKPGDDLVVALRIHCLQTAALKDKGARYTAESAMAKLFASEMVNRVTAKAIQIHGGYGYSAEFPVERIYRDNRLMLIGEGTSEINRLVIARNVLGTR